MIFDPAFARRFKFQHVNSFAWPVAVSPYQIPKTTVELPPYTLCLIDNYLNHASHGQNETDPLFQSINNNRFGTVNKPLNPNSIYQNIIRHYARFTKLDAAVKGLCVHSKRATAATNALQNNADITKVQLLRTTACSPNLCAIKACRYSHAR